MPLDMADQFLRAMAVSQTTIHPKQGVALSSFIC
jgi:hypothetical protein